jgi:hypothetical protein
VLLRRVDLQRSCDGVIVEHGELLDRLLADKELLRSIELLGPENQVDARKDKKLREVAGFCEVILRYVRQFLQKKDRLRVAEFSCGKSYLGIVLVRLLVELESKPAELVGVDVNERLIEKCRRLAEDVGLEDARFIVGRTIDFADEGDWDLVVALHACDTATDEAIARGIQLGARLILTVPCCQNQIRGQVRDGHELTPMTDFGPVRYRLANLLTDSLRAQFLRSAGYYVEMTEIGSPRLTPKNLCICARKTRRGIYPGIDSGYRALKSFFGVRPKVERLCPGVVGQDEE